MYVPSHNKITSEKFTEIYRAIKDYCETEMNNKGTDEFNFVLQTTSNFAIRVFYEAGYEDTVRVTSISPLDVLQLSLLGIQTIKPVSLHYTTLETLTQILIESHPQRNGMSNISVWNTDKAYYQSAYNQSYIDKYGIETFNHAIGYKTIPSSVLTVVQFPDRVPFDINTHLLNVVSSSHEQDCCESHFLDFDFKKEEMESIIKAMEKQHINNIVESVAVCTDEQGIVMRYRFQGGEIIPLFIPGRGYNNGYYSNELTLHVTHPATGKVDTFDITENQYPSD